MGEGRGAGPSPAGRPPVDPGPGSATPWRPQLDGGPDWTTALTAAILTEYCHCRGPILAARANQIEGKRMAIEVELPELGESVVEGTVTQWLVKEGQRVEIDQPLVEVTTDKVDAEIPSPVAGVVSKILVAEGETIAVGVALVTLESGADAIAAPASTGEKATPEKSGASPQPAASPRDPVAGSEAALEETPATPVARRLADDASVDLSDIEGTGSAGRVTKSDVLRHTQGGSEPAAPRPAAAPPVVSPPAAAQALPGYMTYELQPEDRVIPLTPQRRLIAQHMVYSKQTSPHVGTVAEVDMSAVVKLRAVHKTAFQESYGVSLTYLPFIVHATVRALREYPRLNSSVTPEAIIEKKDIHIGIAVETEKGLVAPVLRDTDSLSLSGIAESIDDLSMRARSKKLSADELRGGTFTISNPGRRGNLYGFAIINQPQVGILRMGELVKRPVVRTVDGEDAILVRTMMFLSLSYDHRAVDGAPANGFLYRVRELLEAAEFEL